MEELSNASHKSVRVHFLFFFGGLVNAESVLASERCKPEQLYARGGGGTLQVLQIRYVLQGEGLHPQPLHNGLNQLPLANG